MIYLQFNTFQNPGKGCPNMTVLHTEQQRTLLFLLQDVIAQTKFNQGNLWEVQNVPELHFAHCTSMHPGTDKSNHGHMIRLEGYLKAHVKFYLLPELCCIILYYSSTSQKKCSNKNGDRLQQIIFFFPFIND